MKNIAVLVGGMFREFEYAHKSWSFLKCDNSDVYVSTWDYTTDSVTKLSIDTKTEIFENDIKKFLPNSYVKISSEQSIGIEHSINKMLYHWKVLLEMVQESGNNYKYAILTRPDFYIKENIDLFEFICNINDEKMYTLNDVCVLPKSPYLSINDCFFVAKFDVIKKMILYLEINSEFNDIHIYLSKYLIEKKIIVESLHPKIIEFYVFRSIHRHTNDLTFEENKTLGIEWWNVKNDVGEISNELIQKLKNIYNSPL